MESIKYYLLTGWSIMRLIRLALGCFIAYQAITLHDTMAGIIAAFLLFQALTNTGCCGSQGCATGIPKTKNAVQQETEFEEIKKS